MNILFLLMGGHALRTGMETPKQYHLVQGRPIFLYVLEKYLRQPFLDQAILVSHKDWLEFVEMWVARLSDAEARSKFQAVVPGGDTRAGSVYNGLAAAKRLGLADDSVALLHDVTHPYVDVEGTQKVIELTRLHGAASLVSFSYDSVYRLDDQGRAAGLLPRTGLAMGASPEAFRLGELLSLYEEKGLEHMSSLPCAGAAFIDSGQALPLVKTDLLNLKITFKHDFEVLEELISYFFPEPPRVV